MESKSMTLIQKIDVSYIMTTFNNERTIEASLNSINYSYPSFNVEIIVVNDGSTDGTRKILENFKFNVPSCVLHFEENIGRGNAANLAITRSKGRYIAIIDADDLQIGNRLVMSAKYLDQNKDIDVVAGQYFRFGDWGKSPRISSLSTNPKQISKQLARFRNPIAHSSCMYRKSWFNNLGGYNKDFIRCQDLDLFVRGYSGSNYHIFSDAFMLYRVERRFPKLKYFLQQERWRIIIKIYHERKKYSNNLIELEIKWWTKLILFFKYSLLAFIHTLEVIQEKIK
jgi:glycosyltransferase involved in cell wall biosynthesis